MFLACKLPCTCQNVNNMIVMILVDVHEAQFINWRPQKKTLQLQYVHNYHVNFGLHQKQDKNLSIIIINNVISTNNHKPKIITFIMNTCDYVPLCSFIKSFGAMNVDKHSNNPYPKLHQNLQNFTFCLHSLHWDSIIVVSTIQHIIYHGNEEVNNIDIQPTTSFTSFYVTCPMSPKV